MKQDERRAFRQLVERSFAPVPPQPDAPPKPRGEREKPLSERFMPLPPQTEEKRGKKDRQ